MHTIAFQTNAEKDANLLQDLAQRLGLQSVSDLDTELLSLLKDGELRKEIAVLLFRQEKFTLGKASEFAGLHQYEFQKILAARHIPIHYDIDELQDDMNNLNEGDE